MQRTIRLKLNTNPEHATTLLNTIQEFTHAFNFVCEYGWLNSEKNGIKLHHATYYPIKEMCQGLVSDLIVQARTKATEAVKSALALKKVGKKVGQPKAANCPARYNLHTYKLSWAKQEVNLATSPGNRLHIGFTVPEYASKYIGYPVDTADLICRKGSFWFHVVVTLPDIEFQDNNQTIGVELGLTHPAVTSNRRFLGKRHWKEVDRRYFRLKKSLQSKGRPKGTRSAKRHLKKLSGKVQRFRRDCDHVCPNV